MDSLRLFVDRTDPSPESEWVELTVDSRKAVRARVTDLRAARAYRRNLREEMSARGHDPADISVIIEVRVHLVENRVDVSDCLQHRGDGFADGDCVHYIGTPDGLRGFLDDIQSAGVADGVLLAPLSVDDSVDALIDAVHARI